jgi:hypothetical protein
MYHSHGHIIAYTQTIMGLLLLVLLCPSACLLEHMCGQCGAVPTFRTSRFRLIHAANPHTILMFAFVPPAGVG